MNNNSGGLIRPPFQESRSQQSIFQIEIHTRRSLLEGFTWVLGTNKEGTLIGQEYYDKGFLPFDNNPLKTPHRGLDAISITTSMMIDPSGKQSPNIAEITLNEHVLVYAKYNINQSSEDGFINGSISKNESVGDITPDILTKTRSVNSGAIKDAGAIDEAGQEIRNIINLDFQDTTIKQQEGWMRLRRFLETEIESDDRIVIKTLSHKHLPFVGDNWELALEPIFTGYINTISENGAVGGDEIITLNCKCNLHYLEISKFNVAPTMSPLGAGFDRKLNRFFDPQGDSSGLDLEFGSDIQAQGNNSDLLISGDNLLNQSDFSPTLGLNELINESATSLVLRLLTTDAFESVPVLTLNKANGNPVKYFLQSGVTTQQLSYNNLLGPFNSPNTPLLPNRVNGPNGRLESIAAIPFFNAGTDVNSSIAQFYGEWNTVLDLCGQVANSIEAEFFADEAGRMVLKFPTHGVGINLCPNNDILPNPLAAGGKVPLLLQDNEVISWNFAKNAPALTVIKASSGTGVSSVSEESTAMQNIAIVRFDGTMTLGGLPIGGGENLISKFGIRAQNLPPTNIYLPGSPLVSDSENKLLRATLIQYAMMKGETINDLTRFNGTVTALEDSAYKIGQPIALEFKLREGDYSDQFGFPEKEFYYVQGIQRNINVGQTPTMTLNLTVGRRYPELSGFERAYFSFYQYIVRRNPGNSFLVYPDSSTNINDLVNANFGQNPNSTDLQGAFFTFDPESKNVVGPDKGKLLSLTGDANTFNTAPSSPLDTRIVTARNYSDLSTQINDLTALSNGWSARVNNSIETLFTRPTRRQNKQSNITKKGNYEYIVEPLLKININTLSSQTGVNLDIYPTPQLPISQSFQGVQDPKLLFERILNEQIDIS